MCKEKGCNTDTILARGYCAYHYHRKLNSGELKIVKKIERHGLRKSPEYHSWKAMKKRCNNKTHIAYKRYGGRGIKICDRWLNSFKAFYKDMGPRPFKRAQLDRIDNDLGYFKENCRWVTAAQNVRNSSHIRLTMKKVRQIRYLYSIGTWKQPELAKMYDACQGSISQIVRNKIWKEIPV